MTKETQPSRYSIQRVGAILHKVYPVRDSAGKVIQYIAKPLKVELRYRDLAQILIGASILSVPVGFTEEAWKLGTELPLLNIVLLGVISIVFIAMYVYFTFYRELFHQYRFEYLKRVLAIYFLSLLVVAVLLSIIQVAPWNSDLVVSLKRVVIVALPASMSAALSDSVS